MKFGEELNDIVVISDGCLLYSDWKLRIVNKVMNGEIEMLIKLWNWIFFNLCVIFFGDFLVGMYYDFKF